jgi:hypothetical protein
LGIELNKEALFGKDDVIPPKPPKKPKLAADKKKLVCIYCKSKGHEAQQCWLNPDSPNYRPKLVEKLARATAAAADDEGGEDQDLFDFLDNTLERETRSNSGFGNPAGSSVGNDQASSSSSYRPNYVEDDIAWHRRYLYDQDDESWEDDASSDESTNFAEQVEILCFLSHLAGQDEDSEDKSIVDELISLSGEETTMFICLK